jgi:hypothetical protein
VPVCTVVPVCPVVLVRTVVVVCTVVPVCTVGGVRTLVGVWVVLVFVWVVGAGLRVVVVLSATVRGPPLGGGRSANSASLFSATRLLTYWWACPREGSSVPDLSACKLYARTDEEE